VTLTKKDDFEDSFSFKTSNDRESPEIDDGVFREIAVGGFVNQILQQYNAVLANMEDYLRARAKVEAYASFFGPDALSGADKGTLNERWNKVFATITDSAWGKVLDNPKARSFMTERARKMFDAFNEENILAMFAALGAKRDDLLKATIEDAFDYLTKHHEENREPGEPGWKSNLSWRVRRRCVIPYYISRGWGHVNSDTRQKIQDLERALCLLSGQRFDEIQSCCPQWSVEKRDAGKLLPSTFFDFRFYMGAGTIHLYFRDPQLLKDFNLAAARAKNWLPGTEWA
jgi:hypothetical protein